MAADFAFHVAPAGNTPFYTPPVADFETEPYSPTQPAAVGLAGPPDYIPLDFGSPVLFNPQENHPKFHVLTEVDPVVIDLELEVEEVIDLEPPSPRLFEVAYADVVQQVHADVLAELDAVITAYS